MTVARKHKSPTPKQTVQRTPTAPPSTQMPTVQPVIGTQQTLQRVVTQPGHMVPGGVQMLQRAYGNRAVTGLMPGSRGRLAIQTKLTVNSAGDRYEREADRVAGQVVRGSGGEQARVQRQEEEEGEAVQMQALSSVVQRLSDSDSSTAVAPELESEIQRARGGGSSLPGTVREPMEQAFGSDFSGVRVHADAKADSLNESLQAKAFTTGQDIFFRQGAYRPSSTDGQELIAHELTHVVQQGGGKHQVARRHAQMLQRSFVNRARVRPVSPGLISSAPGPVVQRLVSHHTRRPIGENRMVITMVVQPSGLGHTMLDFEWLQARRRKHYAVHLMADNPFSKSTIKSMGKVGGIFGILVNKALQLFGGAAKVEELQDDPETKEEFFEKFEKGLKAKGKTPTKQSFTVPMRKGNKALRYARSQIGKKRHFAFLFPVRYARTNCFTFAYEVLLKAGLNLDWTAYLRSFISPRWAMAGGMIVPGGRTRRRRWYATRHLRG